jgi:hypothetical protein
MIKIMDKINEIETKKPYEESMKQRTGSLKRQTKSINSWQI